MTDCGCRVEVHMANVPPPTIAYCLLHAHAEAMRNCLRQCAEGAFIMEQRGVLISRAKQVLAQVEGKAGQGDAAGG